MAKGAMRPKKEVKKPKKEKATAAKVVAPSTRETPKKD